MSKINDHIRKILEEKTSNANADMADYGNLMGINGLINNNRIIQQLRPLAAVGKNTATLFSSDHLSRVKGDPNIADKLMSELAMFTALTSIPNMGRDAAKQVEAANIRKRLASQAGGFNYWDPLASTTNTVKNVGSLINSAAMTHLLTHGVGTGGPTAVNSSVIAAKLFGGVSGLGTAATGTVAGGLNGLGQLTGQQALGHSAASMMMGINPAFAGWMAAMMISKGVGKFYDFTQAKGSNLKIGAKALITKGTPPHELERDFGNTELLRQQIISLQNQNILKPGEAIIANILAMIEGHTSVLPYIATEAVDRESRRNREGAGNAQNLLIDRFGDSGAIGSNDQLEKGKLGIVNKLFIGMEKLTANLNSTFNLPAQIANTLAGQSSTKLYNEANDKYKTPEMLKAEKMFGERFGIPTNMVQAIHTTPGQIMNEAETYEGKMLSIMGLHTEISRFAAHELLKIRTDGFGLTHTSSNGYLSKIQDELDEERIRKPVNKYDRFFKGIDETLGYIPGYNVASGAIKIGNDLFNNISSFSKDLKDGKVRNPLQVFNDWMDSGVVNKTLNSDEQLRREVGAVEMSPQELMASYMGTVFPDRFEVLIGHAQHMRESLDHLAGPGVQRTKNPKVSMNKYTGKLGTDQYHEDVDKGIREKIEDQIGLLNPTGSYLESIWRMFRSEEDTQTTHLNRAIKQNPFLEKMLNGWSSPIKKQDDANGDGSVDNEDIKQEQDEEVLKKKPLSIMEKQLAVQQEIRDLIGPKGRDYLGEHLKEKEEAPADDANSSGILTGIASALGVSSAVGTAAMSTASMLTRLGPWGWAAAAVILAGAGIIAYFRGDDNSTNGQIKTLVEADPTGYQNRSLQAIKALSNQDFDKYSKDLSTLDPHISRDDFINERYRRFGVKEFDPTELFVDNLGVSNSFSEENLRNLYSASPQSVANLLKQKDFDKKDLDILTKIYKLKQEAYSKNTPLSAEKIKILEQLVNSLDKTGWNDGHNSILFKDRQLPENYKNYIKKYNSSLTSGNSKTYGTTNIGGDLMTITSQFGDRIINGHHDDHGGIDLSTNGKSVQVRSATDGEVTVAREMKGFGKAIIVKSSNGTSFIYGHLNSIGVKVGDKVKYGSVLGMSGNSGSDKDGNKVPYHLHFGAFTGTFKGKDSNYINPQLAVNDVTSGKNLDVKDVKITTNSKYIPKPTNDSIGHLDAPPPLIDQKTGKKIEGGQTTASNEVKDGLDKMHQITVASTQAIVGAISKASENKEIAANSDTTALATIIDSNKTPVKQLSIFNQLQIA